MKCVVFLGIIAALVACASGADYLWGESKSSDLMLAKDRVKKAFVLGLVVNKKYVFKQKDLDALTITSIRVTDLLGKNGSTAKLLFGGPGSKGATLYFTSERGHGIKSLVEIWGR